MNRFAEIGDGSRRRLRQPGNEPQQGRFARSGAAQQPDDLALRQLEIDAVEHQVLAAVGARKRLLQVMDVEQSGAHIGSSSQPEFALGETV